MGIDLDGNGVGEPVAQWQKPIASTEAQQLQTDDDFSSATLGLQWQWNHNPVDTHWSLSEKKGWLTLKAMPADSLKRCRNMLTQKVVGYFSESTTMVTGSGSSNAGLFCSGKRFRGVGLCSEGVFVETAGQRQIIQKGSFKKLWLKVTNDCMQNRHQFYFSTDGTHFIKAGDSFTMRSGYWKGIRVGVFCYGSSGKAHFDFFQQKVVH